MCHYCMLLINCDESVPLCGDKLVYLKIGNFIVHNIDFEQIINVLFPSINLLTNKNTKMKAETRFG